MGTQADKDGFVWMAMKDGNVVIGTTIHGNICIGNMDDLHRLMHKAGFDGDDRVSLHYSPGSTSVEIRITLDDANLTIYQANLCMKSLVSCLKDAGVIKNPIISRIERRIAQAHLQVVR